MLEGWDLVKFVMCTLISRVNMTFYIYTVPGNQDTHDILNQIQKKRLTHLFSRYEIYLIVELLDYSGNTHIFQFYVYPI